VKNRLGYTPTGRDLEAKSIPLDALHFGDKTELEVHSLFGSYESKATYDFFDM
jgi:alpha-glucosidase